MKLRLKGAKGLLAGPKLTWDGIPEIEIDFTGKTGLIGFDGENGSGKSSVLENLHMYPQLVSRSGALWSHFVGRDAEKEFECDFMGNSYRSLIKMDCEQQKQEGYLWVNGKPTCNGKITQYKEAVNEIFGQPFVYFRSQFCPQKSKATKDMQLENLTVGVFRELLREFLNLQKYSVYEDTAKQAANIYQGKAGQLDARITVLQENISVKEEKKVDVALAQNHLSIKTDELSIFKQAIIDKRTTIDALKATIQQNAVALERRKDLQAQIERVEAELVEEKETVEKEISALAVKYREIKLDIDKQFFPAPLKESIEKAADNVRELESSLAGLVAQIEEENQNVPVYQKRGHDLETDLAELRQQVKDLENDREIATLDRELHRITGQLGNKFDLSKPLADRAEDCASTTCSFIVAALQAEKEIPELEFQKRDIEGTLAARKKSIVTAKFALDEQIKTATNDLGNARQILINTTELLTMHREKLTSIRQEIAAQKALADRLPDVRFAEIRKADLEKQLAEVTEQGTDKKNLWVAKENVYHTRINELCDDRMVIDGQLLEFAGAETKLQGVQWDIREIETSKLPALETEIQAARNKIAALEAELARIAEAETELVEVMHQRELLVRNVSSWRYLQNSCGKNGLQNLRMGAAAPMIVHNANRLLSQAFNALYSVRLQDQDEKGREDMSIKIIMENGNEIFLDDISGGQRVWCVQAITLAMSLLNQEKGGKKFDYYCGDEADGALDADNAEKFTALYRPFMAEAGLSQLCYISHKESCRAMADHILEFSHGKNPQWT